MSQGSILEEASKRYTQASKVTAQIIGEEVKPVIEEVRNIRERMCGRKINGRLHTMPFKKVQSYITYKSRDFPQRWSALKNLGSALYVASRTSRMGTPTSAASKLISILQPLGNIR